MSYDITWDTIPFLSIDTETTGFAKTDRICEIAIVVAQGSRILETFHSLVNPECPISSGAMAVHGITEDMVRDAPKFYEIKSKVLDLLVRDMPWVAHQMIFDARMLSYGIERSEWPLDVPTLCTLDFSKKHHPMMKLRPYHKLADIAGYCQINYDPTSGHNALNDAELLARIVPTMMRGRMVRGAYTKLSQDWLK